MLEMKDALEGFWLFVDAHAAHGDSRILEWNPLMETIPQIALDQYVTDGHDHERTMPGVIADPNPVFQLICHDSWTDRKRLPQV